MNEKRYPYLSAENRPRFVLDTHDSLDELLALHDLAKGKLFEFLVPESHAADIYFEARRQNDLNRPNLNQESLLIPNQAVHQFLVSNSKNLKLEIIDSEQQEQKIYEDFEDAPDFSFRNPNHSIRMNQLGAVPAKIELDDVDMSKIEAPDLTRIEEEPSSRAPIYTKCQSKFLQEATFEKSEQEPFALFKL